MDDDFEVKEIPHQESIWSSRVNISKDGRVKMSYYNALTNHWTYGKEKLPSYDAKGRQGYYVHGRFRTLHSAIQMAWGRDDFPKPRQRKQIDDISLNQTTDAGVSDRSNVSDSSTPKEEWLPLSLKLGVVPCSPKNVVISSLGRVSQNGAILPKRIVNGTQITHVRGFGVIPVDLIKKLLFDNKNARKKPPLRIKTAMKLARMHTRVYDVARQMQVKESTAWTYILLGMRYVSLQTATKVLQKFIWPNAQEAMNRLCKNDPGILSSTLTTLVKAVSDLLQTDKVWDSNPNKYAEVRALRDLIQRAA